jgi:hypothetical protein
LGRHLTIIAKKLSAWFSFRLVKVYLNSRSFLGMKPREPKTYGFSIEVSKLQEGKVDAFMVRNKALVVLEKEKKERNERIINEIEYMIIDLLMPIQGNKCNGIVLVAKSVVGLEPKFLDSITQMD